MCETTEIDKAEGIGKVVEEIKRHKTRIALLAFAVVVFVFAFPLFQQTQIYVEVTNGKINNVWVETPNVPLASTFVSQPKRIGINTINVTIQKANFTVELVDIPDGEFGIIWVTYGVPASDTYQIVVTLKQNDVVIDTFTFNVSF